MSGSALFGTASVQLKERPLEMSNTPPEFTSKSNELLHLI